MKTKLPCLGLVAATILLGGVNQTQASTYAVTVLKSPPGAFYDSPSSLNNSGQVVGDSLVATATVHAMLWEAGKVTDLGTFGGNYSYAEAINDAGVIVGFSVTSAGVNRATLWNGSAGIDLEPSNKLGGYASDINNLGQVVINRPADAGSTHAVLWTDNTVTDLPVFPGSRIYSNASAINDAGEIVGSITDLDSLLTRAVLWHGNTVTDLGTLYENFNSANDISNTGEIVGDSVVANGIRHATLWSGSTITDLGALTPISGSDSESVANAINDAGQIVGYSILDDNPRATVQHATLWDHGALIDLNDALDPASGRTGWEIVNASDINNNGAIVADAWQHGFQHAILLTPVPEPEAFMLLLAGLGLLGFKMRRRTMDFRANTGPSGMKAVYLGRQGQAANF
ncbi:putative secreted protein with PEP-CTERM sorting signal [Nitrosospira sp. Nsp2]|uniref:PEP-CTERM sorting domain-containing protein n=1 Tax=Nitrosospira sp. Nsp2 TaxID=136548 RepID=UPI000D47BD91|nr:PEP-CTERM sorting domain-containing protein [Nitrosospira sp. Nsp2]PTR17596.1 putative secreted protein with PEP-CTERM sorting signal [Nitrosospira sp. Nsp2]